MPSPNPAALALVALALVLVGCAREATNPGPRAPEPLAAAPLDEPAAPEAEPAPSDEAPPDEAPSDDAPPDRVAGEGEGAAQEITFDGDEPEDEPSEQVRGAPKRKPIPGFRLFGTREGDGPK